MGLRLKEGIDPDRFMMLADRPLDPSRIESLIEDGMIERAPEGRLRVTTEGFPVLDSVVADLAS
jgi:oxygen-independent coproporphyrinogen-3 oxidase